MLPSQAHAWHWVESSFSKLARTYGYSEIRTPMFEDIELFIRTSGETSDVVSKEMYEFVDRGGRRLSLKPEGTAPAMRSYVEHSLGAGGGVTRLYYVTPVFRYNRPAKGRYRQHHQTGLELIGSPAPEADAEIIEMTVRHFQALGLKELEVQLNSIGREACRLAYREAVLNHMASYLAEQSEEFQATAQKNPLRLLDTKDPETRAALDGLPPITDYLEPESMARLESIERLLGEAGIPYRISPDVVRGLDYYTETVFEITSGDLGAQNSLCGGGRYDNLIKDIGGPPTPSVGVGMGIERALLVLTELGLVPSAEPPMAFAVSGVPEASPSVRSLARDVRAKGMACLWDVEGKAIKAQMKQVDRSKVRFALIVGSDELAAGTVSIREMATGEQVVVPASEVAAWLDARR
ncbi:MAG: histidine--tRNA ligase [Chthonomonas sp.]